MVSSIGSLNAGKCDRLADCVLCVRQVKRSNDSDGGQMMRKCNFGLNFEKGFIYNKKELNP
ncbi:hypothetical protein MD273_07270 [Marinobacter pelagius]|uniref:hypothetical protein n=1 Tax=Marinobacter sp. C7 TaxID=2951363 RepID=UPI001EF14DAB|nr:hypothetical protein [Marinobacter sp. C7]MCG7199520.1 hypothetical protein [Marinobacter sp. C7]